MTLVIPKCHTVHRRTGGGNFIQISTLPGFEPGRVGGESRANTWPTPRAIDTPTGNFTVYNIAIWQPPPLDIAGGLAISPHFQRHFAMISPGFRQIALIFHVKILLTEKFYLKKYQADLISNR